MSSTKKGKKSGELFFSLEKELLIIFRDKDKYSDFFEARQAREQIN